MALTLRQMEQLAPDQASLTAAGKLRRGSAWPIRSRSDAAGVIWGECQGSGSAPYRICVTPDDLGYRCTCPSRKIPCKHVLALMWHYAESAGELMPDDPPPWVLEWLSRRRGSSRPSPRRTGRDDDLPAPSIAAVEAPEAAAPEDEARAAERREAQRAAREESIRNGLDELDRWILDQLERGLAGFSAVAGEQCRLVARRLVDAKAPGLAALVDELAAELFRVAEPARNGFVMERLGQLHVIAEAYRRQDLLPDALRQDVRRAVGWVQKREEILQDPAALRGCGRWMVAGTRSILQPDRLRRLETWLMRADGEGPDFALLLDFLPAGAGPSGAPFATGEAIRAELAFFPSAAPLRAVIAERRPAADKVAWPFAERSLADAFASWEAALQRVPWLPLWPIACGGCRVAVQGDGFALADGALALPIDAAQRDSLLPLAGLDGIAASGLWDGTHLTLLGARTPIGLWAAS